jgi:hypothetical protein
MSKGDYLTRSNINDVFHVLCNTFEKTLQIDLTQDSKYRKLVKKMMVMIYNHHNMNVSTLNALNALSVEKIGPYLVSMIQNGGNLQPTKITPSSSMRTNNLKNVNVINPMPLNQSDSMGSVLGFNQEAETKTKQEIFSNAQTSDVNSILAVINNDYNTTNNASEANKNALDETYTMPTIEPNQNNFETIQIELDDPGIKNLTPKAKATVNKKEEEEEEKKEEFTNQEDFKEIEKQNLLMKRLIKSLTPVETFHNKDETSNGILVNQSSNRKDKDLKIKTMVLDTGTGFDPLCAFEGKTYWTDVTFTLTEPMLFTKDTDVYLESLTINNPALSNDTNNLYFSFDFYFMNESTYSNNTAFKNKFSLPNENTSGAGDNKIMKYHLKSNYLGTYYGKKLEEIRVIIANENGEQMQRSKPLRDTGFNGPNIVKFTTSYSVGESGAMNVTATWDNDRVIVGESLYNKNGEKIGVVTATSATPDITFGDGILVPVAVGDEIYYAPGRSNFFISPGNIGYIGAANYDDFINQSNDANSYDLGIYVWRVSWPTEGPLKLKGLEDNFKIDQVLYDFNGNIIGTILGFAKTNISAYSSKGNPAGLFFKNGILTSLTGNTPIFTSPPSAVFNNNSKTNRLIMELIFREKRDSKISSD